MLLRCFACVIYHVDNLIDTMVKIPGHDFTKLSLLHDHQLIAQLKPLVTTDPTEGIMTVATGIPPHIELAKQVVKVLDATTDIAHKFDGQTTNLIQAVKDAIENKAWESGHVTGTKLVEILNEFQSTQLKAVDERLNGVRKEFARAMNGGAAPPPADANNAAIAPSRNAGVSYTFMYDGKFYAVPKNFQFPKPKLREAVRFWLCGQSVSANGQQRVKPFKDLQNMLPTNKLKNSYKLSWKKVFAFLDDGVVFPSNSSLTEEQIDKTYNHCIDYLKSRVSYCFAGDKNPVTEWGLSTWANRLSQSTIENKGTASDKEKLPPLTNRNKPKGNVKRVRKESNNPLYLNRQQKRIKARNDAPAAPAPARCCLKGKKGQH